MKQPLWFCSCKLWVKERLSLKQNNFFSFILCYKVLLPYVTNFLSVLTFANERVKIFCLDLFLWVLQKIMFHVLIFVVSPKFAKLQNFVHAQIYCCKLHLPASMDKKTAHHRKEGSPASNPWPDKSVCRNFRLSVYFSINTLLLSISSFIDKTMV